jgi:hypothetical protein
MHGSSSKNKSSVIKTEPFKLPIFGSELFRSREELDRGVLHSATLKHSLP